MLGGTAIWRGLLIAAIACGPVLYGATINPITIDVGGGGPYISTAYVDGTVVPGQYDGIGDGTFVFDNEVQWFTFTVNSATDIYLQTISWAQMGGFTPLLTLFNADGTWTGLGGHDSAGIAPDCGGLGVGDGGYCLDAFISGTVQAGDYLLALTQAGNEMVGSTAADGFMFDAVNGQNFDCDAATYTSSCLGYGSTGAFNAAYSPNPQLNGIWALSVGTPEPASGLMIFSGIAALMGFTKLRASRAGQKQERLDAQKNNAWRAE